MDIDELAIAALAYALPDSVRCRLSCAGEVGPAPACLALAGLGRSNRAVGFGKIEPCHGPFRGGEDSMGVRSREDVSGRARLTARIRESWALPRGTETSPFLAASATVCAP